jgi:hypothetical protein
VIFYSVAFFDIGHAPADHGNRRTDLQGYAACQFHCRVNLPTADSGEGRP